MFDGIDYAFTGRGKEPPVYGWRVNVMEYPEDLYGAMDLIYERHVFDANCFSAGQLDASVDQIVKTLKPGGVFHQGGNLLANLSYIFNRYGGRISDYDVSACQRQYQKLEEDDNPVAQAV